MNKKNYRGRKAIGKQTAIKLFDAFLVIVLATSIGVFQFQKTHFPKGTFIRNVDCSHFTVAQAEDAINEALKSETIELWFQDRTKETILGDEIQLTLANGEQLNEMLTKARENNHERVFLHWEKFSYQEEKLKTKLKEIFALQTNVEKPQNASIRQDKSGFLVIDKETFGNQFDSEKVYQHVANSLNFGETTILLGYLEQVQPEIKEVDLEPKIKPINTILATKIEYELLNGTNAVLDVNTMKDWVTKDENGEYGIETSENVVSFVNTLAEQIENASQKLNFSATEIGNIVLNVPKNKWAIVDREKVVQQILSQLDSGNSLKMELAYEQEPVSKSMNDYIEIDITRQHVWFYQNGKCIVNSPCVTGTKGKHDTPTGMDTLKYKKTDTPLTGRNDNGSSYSSFVHYWMPFHGNVGLHDADGWRKPSEYGGTTYLTHGSHGCVNLPFWAAKAIYENITMNTLIIVYRS